MRKIRENKRFTLFKEKVDNTYIFYRLDKDSKEKERIEAYKQNGKQFNIPFEGEKIKHLILDDFDEFPQSISDLGFGFTNKTINNFFKYKFSQSIDTIIISKNSTSEQKNNIIQINISDLDKLTSFINQEQKACEDTKRILISNFLNEHFPNLSFKYKETNNNKELILRNLNQKLLEQLTADDIEIIGQFYIDAANKYKRKDLVRRMLLGLQKSAQLLTLQEVIKEYEALLKKNPLEKEWQTFFEKNITLFDNRYITQLEQKNIALGLTKYPDLVLVDIYGYIDFYELKKSNAKLLQYDKSHKTYYWSTEMSMAIAQTSDYLQKAKENGPAFAHAIKNATSIEGEKGLEISIINPRAIIVAGVSTDLTNTAMRNQFKNLRESLKDIEFLLYDELLQRLQNLLANIKIK
ncbi:Shedu immune nuclease family protein [Legionella sainthelensi]|uniref:Shedu immune nuclease family protein n=1 Tax=Legionella sainthelensi TaxID=28087 RepID=UPI00135AFBE8|nr:Shedu immune nuclease family protein [Legionella sainthelensi]